MLLADDDRETLQF